MPVGLTYSVTGLDEVNRYLKNAARSIRFQKSFMQKIGVYLTGEFKRNMIRGIDPEGKALPTPARWTRIVGRDSGTGKGRMTGKMIPLNNTGRLRGNLKIQGASKNHVEVGFAGRFLDIADRMINGKPGRIEVRTRKISGYYSGVRTTKKSPMHAYVRANNDGQWITKRVSGGSIAVRPIARNFFFLSKKQVNAINGMVDKKVAEALK